MRLLKSKKHKMYDFLNIFVSLESDQIMNKMITKSDISL